MAAVERATGLQSKTKPDNYVEAATRALSSPQQPRALQREFQDILNQTVHRLRNFLHQGELKAYYFGKDGRDSVSRDFWATTDANGVMELGIYRPLSQRPLCYGFALLLLQSELDAVLNKQPAEKSGLPRAQMPDLVAALRTLNHLPNREKQREALRNERYHLTDDVLREAEKQVPRKPGRKPLRPEQ
jgi:hypothetical protein